MNDLELDVRPILRDGGEPFGAIMGAVGKLAKGQRLRLYATFKPEPLFQVMASRGFANEASPLEDALCRTDPGFLATQGDQETNPGVDQR